MIQVRDSAMATCRQYRGHGHYHRCLFYCISRVRLLPAFPSAGNGIPINLTWPEVEDYCFPVELHHYQPSHLIYLTWPEVEDTHFPVESTSISCCYHIAFDKKCQVP